MTRRAEFERFSRETTKPLLRYTLWRCGNERLAEDLLQEAFLKLWKGQGPLKISHMYTILNSVFYDYLRKLGRQPPGSYVGDFAGIEPIEVENLVLEGDYEVREAIWSLSAVQQTVVYLRYYQEMTPDDIAKEIGYQPDQVSRYLYRAHAKLQKKLSRHAKNRTKKRRATM
nr:RNA polymerase sigma factor [Nocardia bovistercoris]